MGEKAIETVLQLVLDRAFVTFSPCFHLVSDYQSQAASLRPLMT